MAALLLALSWPELRLHPWRNATALLAVVLGVALAFAVQLINASALAEFGAAVRSVNGEPDFELRSPWRGSGGGFDEALYARVAAHPQVAIASPVVEVDTYALGDDGRRVALRVLGLDLLVAARLAPGLLPRIVDGEPRLALLDPGAVFLNPAARAALGLDAAGAPRRLTLLAGSRGSELRVAGDIAASGPPLAVIDIAGAQAEFGLVGRLSRIDVRLAPGADRAAVLRDLALPAGVRAAAPDEAAQRLSNVSRAYRVNLTVLALVALFTGAFLVFSVLALSVAQRLPQFALLGVLGMPARDRLRLVLAESALLGLVGSVLGLALGTALAALALRWLAGDLGGGFFAPGAAPPLQFSVAAALTYGALGVAAAMAGGWLPAREAQRLAPAQALKGLAAADDAGPRHPWLGPALLLAGVLLALCPPLFGLPLAAYAAVGCVLLGGIASVPAMVALLLRGVAPPSRSALALLAVERARRQRHAATIAVAGVVASLALSVALTVMVASFRESMTRWLDTVLPADLYLRGAASLAAGDSVFLAPELVQAVARLPGVTRVAAQRSTQVQLAADRPAVALLARPLRRSGARAAARRRVAAGRAGPRPGLRRARPWRACTAPRRARCSHCRCPMAARRSSTCAACGATTRARAARSSSTPPTIDASPATSASTTSRCGSPPAPTSARCRRRSAAAAGASPVEFAAPGEIRAISLRIFDRSFAVTYWLQAVAIAIGLVGIAASFSAQVLARRKEFALLTHLGLTRRQIVGVVAAEGALWTAAGTLLGLALGIAVSVVLVEVVNPQSFHWTMDLALPHARLGRAVRRGARRGHGDGVARRARAGAPGHGARREGGLVMTAPCPTGTSADPQGPERPPCGPWDAGRLGSGPALGPRQRG